MQWTPYIYRHLCFSYFCERPRWLPVCHVPRWRGVCKDGYEDSSIYSRATRQT